MGGKGTAKQPGYQKKPETLQKLFEELSIKKSTNDDKD